MTTDMQISCSACRVGDRPDPTPIGLPPTPPPAHPYWALKELIEELELRKSTFRFVEYQNPDVPDDIGADRYSTEYEFHTFTGQQVLDGMAWKFVSEARGDTDVGLHSLVVAADGTPAHVGMIDFALDPAQVPPPGHTFKRVMECHAKPSLYSSGRSLHGYLTRDLVPDLTEFLARALLLNDRTRHVVDDRWVAHKLMEGGCVLRWTANQPQYLAIPKLWTPPEFGFWA